MTAIETKGASISSFALNTRFGGAVVSIYFPTGETKHGGDRKLDQVAENATCSKERFTKATADAIGKGERTVQLIAERGKKIGELDRTDLVEPIYPETPTGAA